MPDILATASPVRIEATVADLLRGAQDREPWKAADSLSGSRFERATIEGEPYVVKYLCVDDDWLMRASGDLHCRQLTLMASSVLKSLPAAIDHTVVACAPYMSERGHRGAAVLMRDVSGELVATGSAPISLDAHHRFLRHMAQMHAAYMGFEDTVGLFPMAHHYVILNPVMAELEIAAGSRDPVPRAAREGWETIAAGHPAVSKTLLALAADPSPLTAALRTGPLTLVHGDWKLGNLGAHPNGDTILLDWDRVGAGAPLIDLAWYLAVNCDRLPESKESAIAAYRASLEAAGIGTAGWWDRQLGAALSGAFLQLAWSKAGDVAEFTWWSDRLNEAMPLS